MSVIRSACKVLNTFNDVRPYLRDIVQAADSAKDALGFFPKRIFEDYGRKDLIFVVLVRSGDTDVYGGHLLFDVRFPKATVRQVFVAEPFRGLELGKRLVNALKEQLTALQFISIYARVAEDLHIANQFWEKQGFYTQQLAQGGARRQRTIVIRAHELATPQLFHSSGVTAADPLGLDFKRDQERPLFLLDLNVLFDLGPRRPRHDQAVAVFRAERAQSCSLAISSEIEAELKRTAEKNKTDPMQALAGVLPSFPMPSSEDWDSLAAELTLLIFPERARDNSLKPNDISDIRHLGTAIHHRLPGLVTSDTRVLNCATELRRRYGIEVVSPESFQTVSGDQQSSEIHGTAPEHVLTIQVANNADELEITDLLTRLEVGVTEQSTRWAAVDGDRSTSTRWTVRNGDVLIGYIVWSQTIVDGPVNANIAVSEQSTAAEDSARLMLNHLIGVASTLEIAKIRLRFPRNQVVVREISATVGFTRSSKDDNELQKVVIPRLINEKNWPSIRQSFSDASGVRLPEEAPKFRHIDQQIAVTRPDGERAHVALFTLETYLAPALLCLPGRKGVLVPVQRKFSEHLLMQSPQASLLPKARAQLLQQRHYLSGPATLKVFSRGDLIFFYESSKDHGAGAIIAIGRVLRSYRRAEEALNVEDLVPSVLEKGQLQIIGKAKVKTITAFDNLQRLPCHVPLSFLREIDCGKANQLQTSRRLTQQQIKAILGRGMQ